MAQKPLEDGTVGRPLTFKVSPSLMEKLDALAEAQGMNRSEFIRTALQAVIEKHDPPSRHGVAA